MPLLRINTHAYDSMDEAQAQYQKDRSMPGDAAQQGTLMQWLALTGGNYSYTLSGFSFDREVTWTLKNGLPVRTEDVLSR